jgi:type II secretory pathway pseudopilin PulG
MDTAPTRVEKSKICGWAIASLILAVVSLVAWAIAGLAAIVCGVISIWKIRKSAGRRKGLGIAIAGIVCGAIALTMVGTVAFRAADKVGKRSQARRDVAELTIAIRAYYSAYSRWPSSVALEEETVDNLKLMAVLSPQQGDSLGQTENPQGILFIERKGRQFRDGRMVDPWGQPYHISLDLNRDDQVTVGHQMVSLPVAVWSDGPNKINEYGQGDDISTW